MAFLSFLLFFVGALLLSVLLIGLRTLRLLFGAGRPQKAATTEPANGEKRRQRRLRDELKRSGEYVDFEEVHDTMADFEK